VCVCLFDDRQKVKNQWVGKKEEGNIKGGTYMRGHLCKDRDLDRDIHPCVGKDVCLKQLLDEHTHARV
jgi:hypothetical protein